jgi:NO-binding membrane sensor protein with MHYT domain
MLPETYDPEFVVLSYVVAALGSYTALSLGARLTAMSGRLRVPWLLGGAAAQAAGIWAMHFTGMLALHLPVPIGYFVPLLIASYIIAFMGSLLAMVFTQRPTLSRASLIAGAIFIGAGIFGLHYTDMQAMRMDARAVYYTPWVIVSIVVAVGFGLLSLSLARRYRRDDPLRTRWGQGASAILMGIAISGQHYSAMAGVDFAPAPDDIAPGARFIVRQGELPVIVVVSTLLILTGAFVTAAIDQRRALRAAVSGRLLIAQENQRRGIARILHEDVGQLLTAVRLNLQRITPTEQENAVVVESMSLIDSALTRIRELSLDLRPSVLDDLGLSAAISWFANRHAERSGYELSIEDSLGQRRLPEAIETAAFRITQQALGNVARHSKARHVRIDIDLDARSLDLRVRDDGVGFDVGAARARAEAGESLGVLDMKETAVLAGGTLSLNSTPGKGSTVHARFPLPDQ